MNRWCSLLLAVGVLFGLSHCAAPPEEVRRAIVVKPTEGGELPLYVWAGEGVPGAMSMKIDLSEQKAYLYKGDTMVGWTYVATGRGRYRTPTGSFKISEKKVSKRSNRYGVVLNASGSVVNGDATAGVSSIPAGGRFRGSSMPYWQRLTNSGIGMHQGSIPNPGSPASHGCIRLPRKMAQTLYAETSLGTTVRIVP